MSNFNAQGKNFPCICGDNQFGDKRLSIESRIATQNFFSKTMLYTNKHWNKRCAHHDYQRCGRDKSVEAKYQLKGGLKPDKHLKYLFAKCRISKHTDKGKLDKGK
jgi:hypothetical protein